jgi:hypothetical protein
MFSVMTIITGGMAIGVIEPTLAPHLKEEVNCFCSPKSPSLIMVSFGHIPSPPLPSSLTSLTSSTAAAVLIYLSVSSN